ncbi:hypothetical protein lbkm_0463 [Lachnospiraceae bacterium KM106-2]|nr:hypothetical protein lbkm_0463 [Lachnospiraceae bacterium KM106-2]
MIYIFYALDEVTYELIEGIIKEFYRLLKNDGRLVIKEPKRKGDGMPAEEIENLMSQQGFYKKTAIQDKDTFTAEYRK